MQFMPLNYTLKVVEIANFMVYFVCVLIPSVVSASLRTHSPARLHCPWGFSRHDGDSPGMNTGMGCHALLQGNLPNPETEPSALQADSLLSEPAGKPLIYFITIKKKNQ